MLEYVKIILSFRHWCNSGSKKQIELKNISIYGHLMPSLKEKIVIIIEIIKAIFRKKYEPKSGSYLKIFNASHNHGMQLACIDYVNIRKLYKFDYRNKNI